MNTESTANDFAKKASTICLYIPIACLFFDFIRHASAKEAPFMGVTIGIISFLLLLAGIIFAIIALIHNQKNQTSDKSITRKAVTGLIINGLFLLVMLNSVTDALHSESRFILREKELIQKSQTKSKDLIERSLQDECVSEQALEMLDQQIKAMKELSENDSSPKARIYNVLANILESLREPKAEYEAAFRNFNDTGGTDPSGISLVSDIEQRLAVLDKFEEANEKLNKAFQKLETDLRQRLLSEGVEDQDTEAYINYLKQNFLSATVYQMRDSDRKLIKAYRTVLQIFMKYWGEWTYDKEADELIFVNDSALAEYRKYVSEVDDIAKKQKELQRKALNSIQGRL